MIYFWDFNTEKNTPVSYHTAASGFILEMKEKK